VNVKAMICRSCGAGLEADRIDTSLGIVTCSYCGGLHDSPTVDNKASSNDGDVKPVSAKPERVEVELPRRFKVRRGTGSLEITWPVGGILPGIVLSVMAIVVAYMAISSGVLALLIVCVGLLYLAANRAINQHRIRVDGRRLQVMQGPLPWPGARKIDTSDITQLYASEHESRTETGNSSTRQVRVRKHYRLSANTRDKGRITVLSGLNDPLQALWLEQEIERLLGIADQRVAGEHTYRAN